MLSSASTFCSPSTATTLACGISSACARVITSSLSLPSASSWTFLARMQSGYSLSNNGPSHVLRPGLCGNGGFNVALPRCLPERINHVRRNLVCLRRAPLGGRALLRVIV